MKDALISLASLLGARLAVVLAALALPLAGASAVEDEGFGSYYALIIGIDDYENLPKLETAVNDANAVNAVLRRKYGFKTRLLINPGRYDIVRALDELRADLTEDDNLLIYYAGHGYLDRQSGDGFWLPADADPDSQANWVPVYTVTSTLRAMSAKHVLVIADSCYSGTLLREAPVSLAVGADRMTELRRLSSKRARKALTSGGLEPVVDKGINGHSVFANALLDVLRDNDEVLEGYQLYQGLRRPVILNAEQTPRYSDIRFAEDEGGDFLFVPRPMNAVELAAIAPAAGTPTGSEKAAPPKDRPIEVALFTPRMPKIDIVEMEAEYVALVNANVRQTPSAQTAKVGTLRRGARIAVTGKVRDADWYRVRLENGAGGYVFAPLLGDGEAKAPARSESSGGDALEIVLWQSIEDSDDPASLRAYLKRYPNGTFADLAKARLAAPGSAGTNRKLALLTPPGIRFKKTSRPAQTFKDCEACPEMVRVPAGGFIMVLPSRKTGRYDEGSSQSPVSIRRPFALGRFEVTFAEWDACAAAGGCSHRPSDKGWGRLRQPVIDVSWDDAKQYVRWLSEKTGLGYRLPSEGEWEYAARSGTTTARYWGDDPSAACWYANVHDKTSQAENSFAWLHHDCRDGFAKTAAVGSFEANGFGLHDMMGNVWEWVEDCYSSLYRPAPGDGRAASKEGCGYRMLRGGSWSSVPNVVRSGHRWREVGDHRSKYNGFRVARDLK